MFETIIPHTTPLERDVEKVTAFPDLPIDALASFVDPRRVDVRFLPWLAYRFSVDIWNDDWTEAKKRDVIAQQFDLHRLKGTKEGIARMLRVVDSTLLQSKAFPQRAFATGAITKEQRDAWLARMPQVRIYFVSQRGKANAAGFAGHAIAGRLFARFDAAASIYGRRATIRYPDGTELPLRRSAIETTTETRVAKEFDRIHLPGEAGPAFFAGRSFAGHAFVTKKNKQASIVSVSLDRAYDSRTSRLHLSTASPGLDPIDVKYERFADRRPRGPALFVGDYIGHRFAMRDDADQHIYDRIFLHDPNVDAPWVRGHTFAGHTRIGMKPFNAELLVEVTTKTTRLAAFSGRFFVGRAFATKENLQKAKLSYAAVRRSKAARDRVKVETQTIRRIKFGDGFKFGDGIKFGTKIRNRLR